MMDASSRYARKLKRTTDIARKITRNKNEYSYSWVDEAAVTILRGEDIRKSVETFIKEVEDMIVWRYGHDYTYPPTDTVVDVHVRPLVEDVLYWVATKTQQKVINSIKKRMGILHKEKDLIDGEEYMEEEEAATLLGVTSSVFHNMLVPKYKITSKQKAPRRKLLYCKKEVEETAHKLLEKRLRFKKEKLID